MPKIFISYRRNDSQFTIGRIYDRLNNEFGKENVFLDIINLKPTEVFPKRLTQEIADSDILLIIIGKEWLAINSETGISRLHDPYDWVRKEIELGLNLDKLVMPILVDNATMPSSSSLPESIRDLSNSTARNIRSHLQDFDEDIKKLILDIKELTARDIEGYSDTPPPRKGKIDYSNMPPPRIGCWIMLIIFLFSGVFGIWYQRNQFDNTTLTNDLSPSENVDRVVITWLVGFGIGTEPQQLAPQESVVADFNTSQDKIELKLIVGTDFQNTLDILNSLIEQGTPPDILGPIGISGGNSLPEQWVDLQDVTDIDGYDLSGFDPILLDFYEGTDNKIIGIPFAVFPSVLYYNRDLFDEAGLNYPPTEFGAPYLMNDGTELEWNYDTLAEIAKLLTIDSSGNNATMEEFEPDSVVHFGMNFQWAQMRLIWTNMQPEDIYNKSTNTVVLPESWYLGTEWFHDGMWNSPFIPNDLYSYSEAFNNNNAFSSGRIAMSISPLWYSCCLGESIGNFEWDIAVVPRSFDGEYHVAIDIDSFRLNGNSPYPRETLTVLSYLSNDAVPVLSSIYTSFPARAEYQSAFIEDLEEKYPWDINWEIALNSIAYSNPVNLHHEAFLPNWEIARDRLASFLSLISGDGGATVNLETELERLEADLNTIVNE